MPRYHTLGKIPHKRHTVFKRENGSIHYEQLFGTLRFDGMSSLLYHLHPPTMVNEIHGAIKDAKLLAAVYLELIGGRQSRLDFEIITQEVNSVDDQLFSLNNYNKKINLKNKKIIEINEDDYKLHLSKVHTIKNSIWKKINS